MLFEGILFHKFLPVKRFTIVGIVTSVCRREKVMYLKVDDGTASIQCVFFLEYCNREHINEHKWTEEFNQKKCLRSMMERISTSSLRGGHAKEVELGSLIHLRGDLRLSNGQAELICKTFRELDANDEAMYNLLKLQLYKRIYNVKFDWYQLFLEFLKGNPGVWVVRFLRKMKHSCFTKQDLVNLKSQVLEEPLIDVALRDMRHAGFMYKKEETGSIYQIVECDKELQEHVFNFLQEESDKSLDSVTIRYDHAFLSFINRRCY